MRTPTLSILVLSLVACITAASFQPLLAHRVPALERRQVAVPPESSVPSQCASNCNPVNDEVSLGCPLTACCTSTFQSLYFNCLECIGTALNIANYSSAQIKLNLLYTTCVDIGYILSPVALPGQTASSLNSTQVSASATALSSTVTNGGASSGLGTQASGAAISGGWRSVRGGVFIGTTVLLGVAGLW